MEDDETAYAARMYLISEEDWELLSKEKHNKRDKCDNMINMILNQYSLF